MSKPRVRRHAAPGRLPEWQRQLHRAAAEVGSGCQCGDAGGRDRADDRLAHRRGRCGERASAHGADPNAKESLRGQTALMWAAEKGIAKRSRRCSSAVPISGRARMRGGRRLFFAAQMATSRPCRPCYARGRGRERCAAREHRRRPAPSRGRARRGRRSARPERTASGRRESSLRARRAAAREGANPNAAGPGWTALHHVTWGRKPGLGTNGPPPRGSGQLDSTELDSPSREGRRDLNGRVTRKPSAGTTALNFIGGPRSSSPRALRMSR